MYLKFTVFDKTVFNSQISSTQIKLSSVSMYCW